jgi:hypothetical protein
LNSVGQLSDSLRPAAGPHPEGSRRKRSVLAQFSPAGGYSSRGEILPNWKIVRHLVPNTRTLLIQKLLESDEDLVYPFGVSEIGHGIGDGVVIFQA